MLAAFFFGFLLWVYTHLRSSKFWQPNGCHLAALSLMLSDMANRKVEPRLPPIMHAYLDDLAAVGAYGKDKTNVARTLIEAGIRDAIEKGVVKARNAADHQVEEE